MSPDMLLQHFDAVADAPNGVQKLRELILQLAVRGKLVPQDPSDEPASELLERISVEKQRLFREGKIGRLREEPGIAADEIRSELPEGWEFVCLAELGEFCGGSTPSKSNPAFWGGDIPWVSPKDMKASHITEAEDHITERALQETRLRPIPPKSILIVARSGILKRVLPVSISGMPCTVNQDLKVLIPHLAGMEEYLRILLKGFEPMILRDLVKGGMTVQSLVFAEFEKYPFPLPPLSEQHRIVKKVGQLMALCDELAERQQRRTEKRVRLNRASLHHLTVATDNAEMAEHWQRIRDNFHMLYDAPETVTELRQAILQLAVRGKLVPQDPSDEPASVLLERIEADRQGLDTEGRLGKQKPLASVEPDDVPYEVPNSWEWARFANVANIASNLVNPRAFAEFPHVAPDNIEKSTGRLLEYRTVAEDGVHSSKHRFFPGQILYSKIRPNLSKAVLIDVDGLCSADMYPIDVHISESYLLHYILSSVFLSMAVRNDTRVAMPKINQEELNRVLVPVPPLAEQRRIVEKVDLLMALCDELEAKLTRSRTKAEKLASAVVHHLTAA